MGDEWSELTITEAARRTGLSRDTLRGWVKRGYVPARRHGRQTRVQLADVQSTQQRRTLGPVIPDWRADPDRAGQRLRQLREAAGWTQQQLASQAGLTHEAISRLEGGQHAPLASTVAALARALDVPVERFVDTYPLGLTWLAVPAAATRLDVPPERLQTWLRRGLVEGIKVSGQWRIRAITVADLERSGRLRGPSRRLDPRFRG